MADNVEIRRPEFRNQVLSGLPGEESSRLRPHLARTPLVLAQVLHEVGTPVDAVYFLEDGLVSLIADTGDGGQVEVGMVGRDGLVGVAALLRPDSIAMHRSVVQIPGVAHRIQATRLHDILASSPELRTRCIRYLEFTLVQTAQSAACNARHGLEQRLARWLLMTRDRIGSDDFPITQDFLSHLLGVRRAGVSVVTTALASKNLIRHTRGRLTVLNVEGLEQETCLCYRFAEDSRKQIGLAAPAR